MIYPLRALLGKAIISNASWAERNKNTSYQNLNNNQYTVARVDYGVSRNSNCSLSLVINKKNDNNNRKLVINFHGNDVDAQNSPIFHAVLKDKKIENDFMAIDYPKKANSTRELVDAGVSAVLRAINAGYKAENITITGHSFGGAWSALVLKEMKNYLKEGEKFEGYVNHKSFTNIGNVFVAQRKTSHRNLDEDNDAKIEYQEQNKNFSSKSINFIGSMIGLQFDAATALNDKNLPVKQMKFYAGNQDINVPSEASMAVSMEIRNNISIPTQIKYNETDHQHYARSLFKISKDHNLWGKTDLEVNQKYIKRIFKKALQSIVQHPQK